MLQNDIRINANLVTYITSIRGNEITMEGKQNGKPYVLAGKKRQHICRN